jgi:hypothetical protein
MNISICNAQFHHTGYIKNICCFFRITNAYTLRCRITNSAGRARRARAASRNGGGREASGHEKRASPARRRLQPTSDIKAKLLLCTLGYAPARRRLRPASYIKATLQLCTGLQSRKDVLCALSLGVTERAKLELCFYVRRRLEPAPSGRAGRRRLEPPRPAEFVIRQRRV